MRRKNWKRKITREGKEQYRDWYRIGKVERHEKEELEKEDNEGRERTI